MRATTTANASAGRATPRSFDDQSNKGKKRKIEEVSSSQQSNFEQLREQLLNPNSFSKSQFEIIARICDTQLKVSNQPRSPSVKASEILDELEEEDRTKEQKKKQAALEKEIQQVIDEIKISEAKEETIFEGDWSSRRERIIGTLIFQYRKHLVRLEVVSEHSEDQGTFELFVDGEKLSGLDPQELKQALEISSKVPDDAFRRIMIHLCKPLNDSLRFEFEDAWDGGNSEHRSRFRAYDDFHVAF